MNRLKEMIADRQPVHNRNIDIKTYPVSDDQVVVEGRLRDDRLTPGYQWNGELREAGAVHWIGLRILVGGWPLTILEAEADMNTVPNDICPTTLDSIENIIGVTITSGYSDEIRRRIGGVKGCAHLTHLLVVMGPAALHGFWSQISRRPRPVPKSLDEFHGLSLLKNSCRLWREGGPLIQRIEEALEKGEKTSA